MATLRFRLSPVPPFRLDFTAWALRRRAKNEIDQWDGQAYSRVLAVGESPVWVRITQKSPAARQIEIVASGEKLRDADRFKISVTIERLLGLRCDLSGFYALATSNPKLNELVERFKGLKPPRFASIFEGLVNGIACQQLSLEAGLALLNQLSHQAGIPYFEDGRARYSFPRAEDVSRMRLTTLRRIGFSHHKSRALVALAKSIVEGEFDPERISELSNEKAVERLTEIRGVGRWTAEYVLLRGLGRYDLFPGDDVGARKKLAAWMNLKGAMTYDRVNRALRNLNGYRGLVYFHLLLDGLDRAGALERPISPMLPFVGA